MDEYKKKKKIKRKNRTYNLPDEEEFLYIQEFCSTARCFNQYENLKLKTI